MRWTTPQLNRSAGRGPVTQQPVVINLERGDKFRLLKIGHEPVKGDRKKPAGFRADAFFPGEVCGLVPVYIIRPVARCAETQQQHAMDDPVHG